MTRKQIGILALQGAFEAHRRRITDLGHSALLVKTVSDLDGLSGLILPGGESSTMLKLMTDEMKEALRNYCANDRAVLSTCAGTILLAKQVTNPNQESLGALDVDVVRNGYGRQVDSFISRTVHLTDEGTSALGDSAVEGVFIRAPIISRVGAGVSVLATEQDIPVLIRSKNIISSTFHPELSDGDSSLHRYFLSIIKDSSIS